MLTNHDEILRPTAQSLTKMNFQNKLQEDLKLLKLNQLLQ